MKLINFPIDCLRSAFASKIVKIFFLSVQFCSISFGALQTTAATEEVDINAQKELDATGKNNIQFEYQMENRADPFVPFITEKAAVSSVNMDDIIDNNEPLTGMQLFEPGQLTLVALIKKGNENMAMVQDFTGQGYVISEGTKIGRRGVVRQFTPQSVIIEETTVTRAGKKTVTEVVMQLKKEGDK